MLIIHAIKISKIQIINRMFFTIDTNNIIMQHTYKDKIVHLVVPSKNQYMCPLYISFDASLAA